MRWKRNYETIFEENNSLIDKLNEQKELDKIFERVVSSNTLLTLKFPEKLH